MRGEIDVVLTERINKTEDEEFKKVLEYLAETGVIDPCETMSKFELIAKLADLTKPEKESFRDLKIAASKPG